MSLVGGSSIKWGEDNQTNLSLQTGILARGDERERHEGGMERKSRLGGRKKGRRGLPSEGKDGAVYGLIKEEEEDGHRS